MSSDNEYMRRYMAERYRKRRRAAIKQLGGVCAECGATKKLEIDHIDPHRKGFDLAKALAGWSEARVQQELEKCQLLCPKCHENKTLRDRGQKKARGTHGTISSYRYCHCKKCKQAKREWFREYRRKKRESSSTGS